MITSLYMLGYKKRLPVFYFPICYYIIRHARSTISTD